MLASRLSTPMRLVASDRADGATAGTSGPPGDTTFDPATAAHPAVSAAAASETHATAVAAFRPSLSSPAKRARPQPPSTRPAHAAPGVGRRIVDHTVTITAGTRERAGERVPSDRATTAMRPPSRTLRKTTPGVWANGRLKVTKTLRADCRDACRSRSARTVGSPDPTAA